MNTKIEVIKLNNEDAIATSSQLMAGMSNESYQLKIGVDMFTPTVICGAYLVDARSSAVNAKGGVGELTPYFDYYDENGTLTSVEDVNDLKPLGYVSGSYKPNMWFHYDSSGNWQLCNDESHHCK